MECDPEVWEIIRETHDSTLRNEEKIEHLCRLLKADGNLLDDHESRLRVVEKQQSRWLGRDGAIVAGISAAVSLLIALLGVFWQ